MYFKSSKGGNKTSTMKIFIRVLAVALIGALNVQAAEDMTKRFFRFRSLREEPKSE